MIHFRITVDDVVHQHVIMFEIFAFMPDQRFFAMAQDNGKNSCPVSPLPYFSFDTSGAWLLNRATRHPFMYFC